jgi:phage gpG-like protein
MTADRLEIIGADRLAASLHSAAKDLTNMGDANAKAGGIVVQDARSRAPRRSGRLAGSIQATPAPDGVDIEATVVYAGVIEYGYPSRNIRAQPYLTPAVEATQSHFLTVYQDATQRVLDNVKGA